MFWQDLRGTLSIHSFHISAHYIHDCVKIPGTLRTCCLVTQPEGLHFLAVSPDVMMVRMFLIIYQVGGLQARLASIA
jgi:hypothetical protein